MLEGEVSARGFQGQAEVSVVREWGMCQLRARARSKQLPDFILQWFCTQHCPGGGLHAAGPRA